MKRLLPVLSIIPLLPVSVFAVSPHAACQSRLLRVTSQALEVELPRHDWDVGHIALISYNYGLPGRDRTVFQCVRDSDPDQFCLVQVYTRARSVDPQGCPNYEADEVTSNCEPRRRATRAPWAPMPRPLQGR